MSVDDLLRPRPVFDSFGRYKLRLPGDAKPRGRTRVTTMIRALDQGDGLIAWKATATMVGALRNPGLMAKWAALFAQSTDPWYASDDLKTQCKKLVDECADHGGAQSRADLGTALHTMLELVAKGKTPQLVDPYKADVEAWQATLRAAGLRPLPGFTEVCVYIEKYDLVGTFDGLLEVHPEAPMYATEANILSDNKTETSTDYKALSHAAQLATYSLATHRIIWPANPDDECTLEPLPDFDRQTGLIIHLPAGEARCTLHAVDLEQGRHALELAAAMRKLDAQRKRKDTGGLMRPWNTDLAPAATPPRGVGDAGTGAPPSPVPAPIDAAAGAGLGEVSPPAAASTREGGVANEADIALATQKHAALDDTQKARISRWLREAHDAGRPFGLGGTGNHTTRRLALVESCIAIAQERWTDDDYRSLIAVTGHHDDSFTAPIGGLLATFTHQQATALYQAIRHAARDKEQAHAV